MFAFTRSNVPGLIEAIDRAKDRTGQSKVIVIAHSMGGLVSRAYIEGPRYLNMRRCFSIIYLRQSTLRGAYNCFGGERRVSLMSA